VIFLFLLGVLLMAVLAARVAVYLEHLRHQMQH
jgi:hypothetical protein